MPAPDQFAYLPGGCPSGKIAYLTQDDAERALRYLTVQRIVQRNSGRPRKHEEQRVYPCHQCSHNGQPGWHLTSRAAMVNA